MGKSTQQTTFATSRGLVNTVNNHMPFSYAKKLGYCPKKMYFHVQDFGLAAVKQVIDFYVSIHKTNPAFFWVDRYGEVDGQDNPEVEAARFRRYIFTTLRDNKPLLEKFAGQHYYEAGWGGKERAAHPIQPIERKTAGAR